jgi:hypothetical protein
MGNELSIVTKKPEVAGNVPEQDMKEAAAKVGADEKGGEENDVIIGPETAKVESSAGLSATSTIPTPAPRDPPKYVLSFENLTVHVPETRRRKLCNCLDNPFTYFAQEYMGMQIAETAPFYALDDVSGYLKSGEMCLVLGSDQQNISTLLRALSSRLNDQDEVYGTILLNGMPMNKSNQGWRKICPYVSAFDASKCYNTVNNYL